MYADIEVSEVVVMWHSTDSWNTITCFSASSLLIAQGYAYGSAINLSVSFMILFGSAISS